MKNAPLPKIPGQAPLSHWRRMREERSGAVALIFALALIPIFLVLGVVVFGLGVIIRRRMPAAPREPKVRESYHESMPARSNQPDQNFSEIETQ